jgi:hypothetical protein
VIQVFNYLTGRSRHKDYEQLLVAPVTMRDHILKSIDREIERAREGRPARIVAKMNQLEDPEMMMAIVAASQAGVKCNLIVRGFCCLRAGVPGYTDNVRVTSNIGDFLEHARIFYFANGHEDPLKGDWYIGSADWMQRNLSQRVEIVTPILDPHARQRLYKILKINLEDRHDAWDMGADGAWHKLVASKDATEDSVEALGTFATLRRDAMRAEVEAMKNTRARSVALRELPRRPAEESESPLLGGVERIVGLALLESPWRTVSEIGQRVTISPSLMVATGRRLAEAGFIETISLGRHRVWIPTPSLADAIGGPLSLVRGRKAGWLEHRIGRWLRLAGWRVRRGDETNLDLIAESPDGDQHGWIIKSDRRGAAKALRGAMDDELTQVNAVGVESDVVDVLRRASVKLAACERRRVKVLTLGTVLRRSFVEEAD